MNMSKARISIELGELDQSCFIVMPFNAIFSTQYERVIRPAVEESGLRCIRGDEIYSKPRIMDDIWKSIRASRFVIAELTGKNPNVFYEVGLAQAVGKPVIIITRDENDVPFDLKALRYLYYDVQNPFWGEDLKTRIKAMIQNVLNEDSLSTYLEGIIATKKLEFPIQEEVKPVLSSPAKPQVLSVAGIWRTSYKLPGRDVTSITKVLNLSQEDQNLSGLEIITYFREDIATVIEQALSGIISGRKITLSGVSYTYVQKGDETGYSLDNYELNLSEDAMTMEGRNTDASGELPNVTYKKFSKDLQKDSLQ
jgi:nucleoside 2-deoxyribosyltransferase